MQQQIQNNLSSYVTSSFLLLPLTGTTSIVSSIVGGVIKLPLAKAIDLIGRPEGFAFMTLLATLGLIMMAACKNVETYAAAQVRSTYSYQSRANQVGLLLGRLQWHGLCPRCVHGRYI
jgi:hypothetical protein